jgi:hypothetical protein
LKVSRFVGRRSILAYRLLSKLSQLTKQQKSTHSPARSIHLQIDEDLNFQRREWKIQRGGWVAMALVIIAALLGVFGTGPLSSATIEGEGLRLEHERFCRLERGTDLRFTLAGTGDPALLLIGGEYLDRVMIERITPEPVKVEGVSAGVVFQFVLQGPASVTFHLKPKKFGLAPGKARLGQAAPITFTQFIYP